MYRTKWLVLENDTQKVEMTHYKALDGNMVIVSIYFTKTGCGDVNETIGMTTAKANDYFKDLLSVGWKITKYSWV